MPTTPTPGAIRAANRIIVDTWNNQSEYILHTARAIDEETHAGKLATVLKDLFKHCVMIHKYGGKIDNTKEADAAIKSAHAALISATEGEH